MDKYLLIIQADTNDADYIYRFEEVTAADVCRLAAIMGEMRTAGPDLFDKKSVWYGTSEYCRESGPDEMYAEVLTEEELKWLESLVPYGEYGVNNFSAKAYLIAAGSVVIEV